jgi:hypothetical protein
LGLRLAANTFRPFRAIAIFHLSPYLLTIMFSLFRPESFYFRTAWDFLSHIVCAAAARRFRLRFPGLFVANSAAFAPAARKSLAIPDISVRFLKFATYLSKYRSSGRIAISDSK